MLNFENSLLESMILLAIPEHQKLKIPSQVESNLQRYLSLMETTLSWKEPMELKIF